MASFKDKNGKEHILTVSVTTCRKVKAKTEFLLTDLVTQEEALKSLDPIKLFEILHATLAASGSEMDIDSFGEALDDESSQAGVNALVEATIDFFPPARRKILREGWQKTVTLLEEADEKVTDALRKGIRSPAFESALRSSLFGTGSTSSPASSESTRDRSPSGNSSRRRRAKPAANGTDSAT